MKKTKILFIHHGTGIGGAPISLLNLVSRLNQEKFSVKVAFVKGGVAEELFREKGIDTEVIGASNMWFAHNQTGRIHWRYFYRYVRIYLEWMRTAHKVAPAYLSKQEADIVHLNSHVLTSWAYAAKKAGKKVVMHNREAIARGYFGFRYSILRRLIEKNCDRIINISRDNMRRLGICAGASVVYNFVELPKAYRTTMNSLDSNIKVLYLGGMAPIKGYKVVVECLPYLHKNITVQFGGSMGKLSTGMSLIDKLKDLIKLSFFGNSYRLLKRIHRARNAQVLGLVKNPLAAINQCDILISPFKIEHFSRPAIEAFAYGKPVVASNVEGMDEIIDHEVNGLLVQKGDPKALAGAINYLSANPEVARRFGENARRKAVAYFSPQQNMRKVESIYDEMMSQKG